MYKVKGINLVHIRQLLRNEPEKESRFLTELLPELQSIYLTAVGGTWIAQTAISEIYKCAALILYPDNLEPIVSLGRQTAKMTFNGIYRFFIRIPSPEYILKRITNFWHLYQESGRVNYRNITANSIDFTISDYPEMTPVIRRMIAGFILAIAELIGLQEMKVSILETNPQEWLWHLVWEKPLLDLKKTI